MDFIKTSSLRALIELTFQRNWNGLIWMSRKGVITKRVKTVQTALSRTAPTAQRLAEERMFRVGQIIRPSEVSAKVQTATGRYASRPGKQCPAVGQPHHSRCRARPCRASREASLAAAQPLTYHGRCAVRAGKATSASAEKHRPTSSVRPQRPTTNPSGHDRSDRTEPMTRLSGRSSRPTVRTPRSTRSPFHVFSSPA
ncbi:unnamed protein product [Microthlaspi erraticum]|uniref:Uncharacterized protein n=1 Tax=Microthlaspi erraticum TaxID=1685480 RepID=A0A6D2J9Q6_9BRAS|nr:unnamed protein product [Microthlaspi erraticum]